MQNLSKEDEEIMRRIQQEADNELDRMETFGPSIREQIKTEYDRMIAERNEWLRNKKNSTTE